MNAYSSNRIAYWDNLKAVLIFLVVLGHFLLPIHDKRGISTFAVYTWIYLFHMPAFVFVSGFFSKKYVNEGAKDIRKIIGFLVLYIVYCLPNWVYTSCIAHGSVRLFSPVSAQWYLLCMALWYSMIPLCAKFKPTPILITSVVIGLLVGTDPEAGAFLSLSRCLVFFPFFLAGYFYGGSKILFVRKRKKIAAFIIMFVTLLSIFIFPDFYRKHIAVLYADSAYASNLYGILERFIWYILSCILVISFLCLIPNKVLPFTYIGQRTLAIYIFHRPLRGVCRHLGVYKYLGSDIIALSICLIVSLFVTVILSESHITTVINRVFTADYKYLIQESHR